MSLGKVDAAADSGDTVALHNDVPYRETLPELGSGLNGGIHQDLVQHCAPRAVSLSEASRLKRRRREDEFPEV